MNFLFVLIIFIALFPSRTNSIRCYKCDATNECRTIKSGSSFKNYDYLSDNVEIIDCEYYCWKSVSLGNVYRGCAKKRCSVSHTIGEFSSSVCCQADYCNASRRVFLSKLLFITLILSNLFR
ncbi:unnamed protein product [Rotaria socialis]|uniref:Uncharacterized protein n=1 Tax=Rotaria socialis TaxID=392032 RepID=A0A818TTQ3_9BILA|nr:unnamed protein product [Rotaria socialis]CAF3686849.1 unnamed protein product [Rotaria socialis]CAF3706136.1 unnamed protein product [Rotaria socialis]